MGFNLSLQMLRLGRGVELYDYFTILTPENSVVDGAMFRAWGSGEWGNPGPGWRPVWGEPGGYENQPEMQAALQSLRDAQRNLETASHDKGGYRAKALDLVRQAIADVESGMQYDNTHR